MRRDYYERITLDKDKVLKVGERDRHTTPFITIFKTIVTKMKKGEEERRKKFAPQASRCGLGTFVEGTVHRYCMLYVI